MEPNDESESPQFNPRPVGSQLQPPRPTQFSHEQRPARSKNGCLTCRRRKVRCDEQRPRCSHCERLNLQCRWRPSYTATQWRFVGNEPGPFTIDSMPPSQQGGHSGEQVQTFADMGEPRANGAAANGSLLIPQNYGAVDQVFDYASFLWDVGGGDSLGQDSPNHPRLDFGAENDWIDPYTNMNHHQDTSAGGHLTPSEPLAPLRGPHPTQNLVLQPASQSRAPPPLQSHPAEAQDLISYFVRTVVPPILAEVETQKRWSSMRQILVSMSNHSAMVRNGILAFAVLLWCRREGPGVAYPPCYYQDAVAEIEAVGAVGAIVEHTATRVHMLATLFFLSYVDILGDRMGGAVKHLKLAFQIFQQGNKRGFRPVEVRLLSWLRLLDARAVSAGGEGLFLSDNGEALIVHPSPASVDETAQSDTGGRDEVKEWDIEDVLFQVLYQPGIVFFQKVQSFMGRISKIDPWHRSRGTVEDETEVMHIASCILSDLRGLYEDRPTLMDHAVEGRLTAPHVSPELAASITRAFRTYLSNYHASKVHLHRVAYKHLPLSRETTDALNQIRHLTRLMVEDMGDGPDAAALPVSQLWPLLMLGSEETHPPQRAWIKEQILRMEKVATNAGVTAQVLEEVQARQDAGKARVDIRAVMHDVFDSSFAIM